ncbi:short-chain dehydrogenase/reductase family 9C member 7-like [Pomacea canaliculata]|nr:short-chain dehydrogenase/reductase family 9C member 7-like [Pomacea canaliculata]
MMLRKRSCISSVTDKDCSFVAGLFFSLVLIYQVVTWLRSRMRVGDYDKKHVLVTGCDTGFGCLLVKRLDVLGFRVFAACLTSQGAEKLQAASSSRVTTLVLDVTDEKSISAARDFVAASLPEGQGLWGVVNNARHRRSCRFPANHKMSGANRLSRHSGATVSDDVYRWIAVCLPRKLASCKFSSIVTSIYLVYVYIFQDCIFVAQLFLALVLIYQLVTWLRSRLRVGDYDKKHVLVTGCGNGFGYLVAKRLDVLGFRVFAACRTSQAAEKLQEESSSRVTTLVLDVTDEKSISAARDFVAARLPEGQGLWGVVNNAAIAGPNAPSEWVSRDGYQTCLAVNLFGLIDVTRTFLPLVRRARGRVVNISSVSGRIAVGPSPYCVSKYGVEAFSDCLRREVYRQGVQVCIIETGLFKTNINKQDISFKSFKMSYDATPADIRQHYPDWTVEAFSKMITRASAIISPKLHLVVDAYVLALTSRFPPTRQLVGSDVRLFYRLLWNLPTPLTDWILVKLLESAAH